METCLDFSCMLIKSYAMVWEGLSIGAWLSAICCVLIAVIIQRVATFGRVFIWRRFMFRRVMAAQGVYGPRPHLVTGNLVEIHDLRAAAWRTPLNGMEHDYVDRLFPHYRLWTEKYGPKFLAWLGVQPVVLETDPELIKEVFSSNYTGSYSKHGPQTAMSKKLTGDALFALNGMKWLHRRRAIRPAFQANHIKGLVEPIMKSTKKILIDKWERLVSQSETGKYCIDDVVPHIAALSGDVIARTLFRSSYEESNHAFEQHKELIKLEFYGQQFEGPWWAIGSHVRYVSMSIRREYRRIQLHRSIQRTLREIVDKAIAEESNQVECSDFLGMLLSANNDPATIHNGFQMSKEDLTHEARSFYTAGYGAPATILNWTIMLLAHYTDWQERIYEELKQVWGADEVPTMSSLDKLTVLSMVLHEALRLYTPAPETARTAVRDVQLGRLKILKGTSVSICIPMLHRLPQFWGDDANEFKPERFKDGVAAARKHPVAYMPFSYGPRYCVAKSFAVLEIRCILAMIIQRFTFRLSPTYIHAPILVGVSIQPKHGLPIILSKR